jgi:uncharacterized protein YcnI
MSRHQKLARALTVAVGATTFFVASAAGIAPAFAHVQAHSDDAVRGGMAVVTFQVPNESTKGAATTALTVDLSNVTAVQTEAKPGWTAKLDRDSPSGVVRSATWTAVPKGGIPVDQFGLFRISVKLPDADTVSFPATQTYADGSVVKWDQPTQAGGAEPSNPVPVLALSEGQTPPPSRHLTPSSTTAPTTRGEPQAQKSRPAADNTARVLGGAALLLGAAGIGLALVARRT